VEPEKGRSATLEAAHKTLALHALNGRWPGVTVNVGELQGGTRPNIVAEECVITVDMRARLTVEQDEAEAAIYEILQTSTVPDITIEIEKLAHSRPMEKTEASAELVDAAVAIAAGLTSS
jgi:glutamate carboxypeptidase